MLLELYGLVLGLSHRVSDSAFSQDIERKLFKEIEDFVLKGLRKRYDVELANLQTKFNSFKTKLALLRSPMDEKIRAEENASYTQSISSCDEAPVKVSSGAYKLVCEQRTEPATKSQLERRRVYKSMNELIRAMAEYISDLLGPAPCRYTLVGLGSLAIRMTTAYSDIEYILLVENNDRQETLYFEQFCELFDFFMLAFGETPAYYAEALLAQHFPRETIQTYFSFFRKGMRVDEHKRPRDNNPLLNLINTSQGLLKHLPNNIVHEKGNHLTAALLTTEWLYGDKALYKVYQEDFARALQSKEYYDCLVRLLKLDSSNFETEILNFDRRIKTRDATELELKPLLSLSMHLVRGLQLFLRSCGEEISLQLNPLDILAELRDRRYITEIQYKLWNETIRTLFSLRQELQQKNKSSHAKISAVELQAKLSCPIIELRTLIEILNQFVNSKKPPTVISLESLFKPKIENAAEGVSLVEMLKSGKMIGWNLPSVPNQFIGQRNYLNPWMNSYPPIKLMLKEA